MGVAQDVSRRPLWPPALGAEQSVGWGAFSHSPAGCVVEASALVACGRLCLASQMWHFAGGGVSGGASWLVAPVIRDHGPPPDVTWPSGSGELAVHGCVIALLGSWFSAQKKCFLFSGPQLWVHMHVFCLGVVCRAGGSLSPCELLRAGGGGRGDGSFCQRAGACPVLWGGQGPGHSAAATAWASGPWLLSAVTMW